MVECELRWVYECKRARVQLFCKRIEWNGMANDDSINVMAATGGNADIYICGPVCVSVCAKTTTINDVDIHLASTKCHCLDQIRCYVIIGEFILQCV